MPTPPPTITAPVFLSTDGFVRVDKFNCPVVDNKFPLVIVICLTVIFPGKFKSVVRPREPPIFKLPSIPTPPLITTAPDCLLFDTVELLTTRIPLKETSFVKCENPPTFKLPPIPAPPDTTNAPFPTAVEGAVLVIEKAPVSTLFPLNVVVPLILILLLIVVFPKVLPITIFVAAPPKYIVWTSVFAIFNVELFDTILPPSFICMSPPEIRTVPDMSKT